MKNDFFKLKDSQEKEAVARKAYEESLSMKRPWVLAGNTLAKLYLKDMRFQNVRYTR